MLRVFETGEIHFYVHFRMQGFVILNHWNILFIKSFAWTLTCLY